MQKLKHTLLLSTWLTAVGLSNFAQAESLADKKARDDRNKNAIQTIYRDGVPHTDRRGRVMLKYEEGKSFFPIGLWGPPLPRSGDASSWDLLKGLNYNTVWPWPAMISDTMDAGALYGMQIILMGPIAAETLGSIRDNANLLGNVWYDEPIGKLTDKTVDMNQLYNEFVEYRNKAAEIAPDMAVFINDAPWIMEPATNWWKKWNTAGTVSCHDNYPILAAAGPTSGLPSSIGLGPNGIPQSVKLAVEVNGQKKPVWMIVGAFENKPQKGASFPFRYPTPMQLRSQVYSAIISGATGIHYFTLDSWVSRDGDVIGMAPNPQPSYPPDNDASATPMELVSSRALWDAAGRINAELSELTPVILSPTVSASVDYKVEITGTSVAPVPILCLLKPGKDGSYVLLTVNLDNALLQVKYTFPFGLDEVEKMFENQSPENVESGQKEFSVQYEPFDVHVFRILPTVKK